MRIVLIGRTGGSGKTTYATQGLAPRMNEPVYYAVETINQTGEAFGTVVIKVSADQFMKLIKPLLIEDELILDVGASNIEIFEEGLVKYNKVKDEIDYFIIPTTSSTRDQKETISLVETLNGLGIPQDKIKIIFNRVKECVEDEFEILLTYHKKKRTCDISADYAIYETELMDLLQIHQISVQDLLNDKTDYKAMIKKLDPKKDEKTIDRYTTLYVMKELAPGVSRNMDSVFSALFPKEATRV